MSGPQAKDCGTNAFRGIAGTLDYKLAVKPRDQLQVTATGGESPFKTCPAGGAAFPQLVTEKADKPMTMRMPRGELFDRSLGKFILIGKGREASTTGEHRYTTTSRWVVTMVRLRR